MAVAQEPVVISLILGAYLHLEDLLVDLMRTHRFPGGHGNDSHSGSYYRPPRSELKFTGRGALTLELFLSHLIEWPTPKVGTIRPWQTCLWPVCRMSQLQSKLPLAPTYAEVVNALWKRYPGLSPEDHVNAFSGASQQLGEDIRTFANWLEDLYDQGYPDTCRTTRDLQLWSKLWESLPINIFDILIAVNCCSFAEAVQVVHHYDHAHGPDQMRPSQAPT